MKRLITRLFIIAITPAISIAYAVYLSDRYDREPIGLLIKTFILGALVVIPTIVVERILMYFNVFPGLIGIAYTAFAVAGLVEEFFKREVVLRLAYQSKHFNEKLDGIVYAIFSALGFATIENIIYVVFRFTYNSYVGLYRGILSVPAHGIFAVTMGYYLSLAKFTNNEVEKRNYLNKSLYMPLILHGIFDFILMSRIPFLAFLFVPYVFYLWRTNQIKLNKYIVESKRNFDDINREDKN
ncbi:PrsW family intramembrane metalloprotease [Thermohalobacter berrensis]|uniref:Protease PrsW n=1 Tax=Thermohalobacter berrensis TaxID=99594 RepID=A0A419T9S3_9FIRM|nr:PrsW family glutamic-type intramembrane protease [Thermohalobacter berrensis]RKD34216.1 peptidase [Thermohalobacter berrensis]